MKSHWKYGFSIFAAAFFILTGVIIESDRPIAYKEMMALVTASFGIFSSLMVHDAVRQEWKK